MAQKDRTVRRIDERPSNLITGGGAILVGGETNNIAPYIPTAPEPENVVVGAQVLLRTTLVPKVLVQLTWEAPVNLIPEMYLVEYAEDSGFTSHLLRVSTSVTRAALEMKPNTDYWIRVQAVIRGIYSEYAYPTGSPSVHTIGDTTPPNAVSSVTATWATGDLEIKWTNPSSDNFFQTRVRIYDVAPGSGGTLYKEVFIVGTPASISRYVFRVADNMQVTSNNPLVSVYYELYAYSLAGVPSLTAVTGTATKAKPTQPTGLSNTWSTDDGTFDEGLTLNWTNQTGIQDWIVVIDGTSRTIYNNQFIYPYTANVADHRPTLASGKYNPSYTIQARDALGQVSPGASGTATNLAPTSANLALNTAAGFSTLYAYVTPTKEIQDFHHYTWILASGTAIVQTVVTYTPEINFASLKGTYAVAVQATDLFGRISSKVSASGIVLDGLTIEELRSAAIYSDSIFTSPTTLAGLKDNITNVAIVTYASGTSYKWTKQERALIDRYRTVTVATQNGATLPTLYFGFSTDDTTYRWFSGPLVSTGAIAGTTTLTEHASEVIAQASGIAMSSAVMRYDLPAVIDSRFIKLGHRRTTSTYNFSEFYARRLVQSDDIEAESLKSINIAASQILADHIQVTNLGAINANIGQLVIDTTGYLFQGTGTAASPTTGLKIYQTSGIGRLTTWSAGVVQIDLDTTGRLLAGAGNTILDANGLSLIAAGTLATSRAITFKKASLANTFQIYAINLSTTSQQFIIANETASGDLGHISLQANAGANGTSLELESSPVSATDPYIQGSLTHSSTNTIRNVLRLTRGSTGTPANNIGLQVAFGVDSTSGATDEDIANIDVYWSTATFASRTSTMKFYLNDSSGAQNILTLTPTAVSVAGTLVSTGTIEATTGQIGTKGATAGVYFEDRTGGFNWQWYGTSSAARLYNGTSDVFSIDNNGVGTITLSSALTNSITTAFTFTHATSATAAAGFGTQVVWNLETSTGASRIAANIQVVWADATDTTYNSEIRFFARDGNGAANNGREVLRLGSTSANVAGLSFFGGGVAAKQAVTGVRTGTLAQLQTVVANILTALANYTLWTDSTT